MSKTISQIAVGYNSPNVKLPSLFKAREGESQTECARNFA